MQIPTTLHAAGPFGLGGPEVLVIAVVFLVLFGGKKLPEMAKGLGQGIKEFKHAVKEGQEEVTKDTTAEPKKPA